jgi:hypothetical protein
MPDEESGHSHFSLTVTAATAGGFKRAVRELQLLAGVEDPNEDEEEEEPVPEKEPEAA